MVVESRDVEENLLTHQEPVPRLIAVEFFRFEIGIGIETRKERKTVHDVAGETEESKICLRIGGSSNRVREGRPDALFVTGGPEQPAGGLQLPAGVVCA